MDVGFLIGAWVGFMFGLLIRQLLHNCPPVTRATPGICGTECPKVSTRSTPLFCTLPAGHKGWHHHDATGADWSVAA